AATNATTTRAGTPPHLPNTAPPTPWGPISITPTGLTHGFHPTKQPFVRPSVEPVPTARGLAGDACDPGHCRDEHVVAYSLRCSCLMGRPLVRFAAREGGAMSRRFGGG